MNISENNYITASGSGDSFLINIDAITPGLTYYKESLIAAEKIESAKSGKIYIMYSGGVDSEYTVSIFQNAKIDFTPVIIKFNNDYNLHDIQYALDFCKNKNLNPLVIDINFDHFVKSGQLLDISKTIQSSVYHRAATAYAIGQLDGTVICGEGEPYIKKDKSNTWNVTIYQHDYAIVNYYKMNNIIGTPHFNRYTPEMMRTFLEDPRIKELASNQVPGKLGSDSSKYIIYNRHNQFDLKERPKYHGYEQIEKMDIFQHESFKELSEIGKQWDGSWSMNYENFLNTICIQ